MSVLPIRDRSAFPHGIDPAYWEAMYQRWLADPAAVPDSWRYFFEGMAFAGQGGNAASGFDGQFAHLQSQVSSLIYAYRSRGHLIAQVDPLGSSPKEHTALDPANWGFSDADYDREFDAGHLPGSARMSLREILQILRDTYCGSIGVEYVHIQQREIRRWLQKEMEPTRNRPSFSHEDKVYILKALTDAEQFETFLHQRYPGQKRFSLEGSESLIPGLLQLIDRGAELGVEEIVLGMAHRGRLNVLVNVVGMSYEMLLSQFEGDVLEESVHGDGDVKYHKGYGSTRVTRSGAAVDLSLTANPSHLEAVDPVVEGRTRAKQRQRGDTEKRQKVLPVLIHGDAAFAGQGIVAETLNLSQLVGYRTGGTVHIVVNNQIGFTTSPKEGRSSIYCTDVAKTVEAPIFHVNGDEPESVVFVVDLALRFRQMFGRDVVVDLWCYRRHGHNEGDDPAFTQPLLYEKIRNRPSVRHIYTERLMAERQIDQAEVERQSRELREELDAAAKKAKKERPVVDSRMFEGVWEGLDAQFSFDLVPTGVAPERLERVARTLCEVPPGFSLNSKVARQLEKRWDAVQKKGDIDWAFAELLAIGTLLDEGTPVRLSGQDTPRGTFSQRHAVWQDTKTQESYTPLNHLREGQARFCIYNSSLSEAAVLGFEYGYSLSEPRMLILWEAQFGDFVNGAQSIIDQFISAADSKWGRQSGLGLLLPHGYEGQGPEHSNGYVERFLQACAEENLQVCNLTTPAQYFHLLRRQVRRDFRLPLILMTPKSMLRHPRAVSPVEALVGGGFGEVLPDPSLAGGAARRVVLCTGKVFWDLLEERERAKVGDVALVRVEQLYPLHRRLLEEVVAAYGGASEIVWAQEEPQNRGAWTYMLPRLMETFPGRSINYVGRAASASAATGSLLAHRKQQEALVKESIHGAVQGRPLRAAQGMR